MLKLIRNSTCVLIFNNSEANLVGCIAIDEANKNQPAIGGTRISKYESIESALQDAILLAKTMTKKCQIANIPFKGGKAVIIEPPKDANRTLFFKEYGNIINNLNGGFITGCDVGVSNIEMKIVRSISPYITGLEYNKHDYLSKLTAFGVYRSIQISLKQLYDIDSLDSVRILVQGVGKVGQNLSKILHTKNAKLLVTDLDRSKVNKLKSSISCEEIEQNNIFNVDYDIFVPCALGGIINEKTLPKIKCKLICGAANNPIINYRLLRNLDKSGIVFIPDWISNVGGTIYAALSYQNKDINEIKIFVEQTITSRTQEFLSIYQKSNLYDAVTSMMDL